MSYILHGFGIQLKNLKAKQINSNNNKTLKQPKELAWKPERLKFKASSYLSVAGKQIPCAIY